MTAIVNNFTGGADMRYTFVSSTDYRKDNISVQYQLQGIHSTKVMHYNDTLDFLVQKADAGTVLKVGCPTVCAMLNYCCCQLGILHLSY